MQIYEKFQKRLIGNQWLPADGHVTIDLRWSRDLLSRNLVKVQHRNVTYLGDRCRYTRNSKSDSYEIRGRRLDGHVTIDLGWSRDLLSRN